MSRILIFILIVGVFTTCVLSQGENECSDPNSVWTDCGSSCPGVCGRPSGGKACTTVCVPGCVCKYPYSRDSSTGTCIKC